VTVVFVVWDIYFTAQNVWGFNPKYTTGITVVNLPIEEVLFFICIPFACVFTYHCLAGYFRLTWNSKIESFFLLALSLVLLVVGVFYIDRMYTSVTFISSGIILLYLKFVAKVQWVGQSLSVYSILLFPFFIVNGLLTGTGLPEPVVRYNNAENLTIRILTIPIEDLVYGYELFVLNLFFYHLFKESTFPLTQLTFKINKRPVGK
jgi:lycopene cyclase domain-containing protein